MTIGPEHLATFLAAAIAASAALYGVIMQTRARLVATRLEVEQKDRVLAVDAYRGLVQTLQGEVIRLTAKVEALTEKADKLAAAVDHWKDVSEALEREVTLLRARLGAEPRPDAPAV